MKKKKTPYKQIYVLIETHGKFAKEADDEGRTFDKFLNILLDLWRRKKQSNKK